MNHCSCSRHGFGVGTSILLAFALASASPVALLYVSVLRVEAGLAVVMLLAMMSLRVWGSWLR